MNPFSLTFGKEPANAISRDKQMNEIVEGFTSDNFPRERLASHHGAGRCWKPPVPEM